MKLKCAPDHALDEARLRKAIEAAPVEGVALTEAKKQRQVAWLAKVRQLRIARLVNLAELVNDLLSDADAAEPASRPCRRRESSAPPRGPSRSCRSPPTARLERLTCAHFIAPSSYIAARATEAPGS